MHLQPLMNELAASDLQHRLAKLITLGVVEEVDYDKARVRVRIGEWLTTWLPWLTGRASNNLDWHGLEVGEQVVVLSPCGDTAQGVVLGSVYQQQQHVFMHDVATEDRQHVHRIKYQDGTSIEYDRKNSKLKLNVVGDIEINALGNISIEAGGSMTLKSESEMQLQSASEMKLKAANEMKLNASHIHAQE